MRKLLVVVTLLLIATTTAHAQFQVTHFAPSTNKPIYGLGEPVTLILTNTGMSPYTFTSPAEIIKTCFIFNASGQRVFDGSTLITPAYVDPVIVLPMQSCTTTWLQAANVPGRQITAGTYYFGTTQSAPLSACAQFAIVPEPSGVVALLGGICSLGLMFRRRR